MTNVKCKRVSRNLLCKESKFLCLSNSNHTSHISPPEWFALDADFLGAVLEEESRGFRNDVLDPHPSLQELSEPPQKRDEVLCVTDVAWHGL